MRAKDSSFHMDKVGFTLTGSISRAEYGMKWNETFQGGGPVVGDKVNLDLVIELNKQS